jgi:hypothetical protein
MKLWLVERTNYFGYDEYDSLVVAANTAEDAKKIHPSTTSEHNIFWEQDMGWVYRTTYGTHKDTSWTDIKNLKVSYLGTTDREIEGVILASFNAG